METLKKLAGVKAAEFVEDGMVVGLGTGSTAYYFVEEIGRRIKEEGLQITAVTTSSVTSKQAEGLGIPLKSIDEVDQVDVTVDGADEVDPQYGAEQVFRRFVEAGYKPSFREKNGQRFITDMQNFIIDLDLGVIENPVEFGRELDHIVGVVEHGLFTKMVNKVIVAGQGGVNILEANN